MPENTCKRSLERFFISIFVAVILAVYMVILIVVFEDIIFRAIFAVILYAIFIVLYWMITSPNKIGVTENGLMLYWRKKRKEIKFKDIKRISNEHYWSFVIHLKNKKQIHLFALGKHHNCYLRIKEIIENKYYDK